MAIGYFFNPTFDFLSKSPEIIGYFLPLSARATFATRVWLDTLAYTRLRRGDVVRLGRQHVRDGIATLKTEKGASIVTLPILPVLAATLAAGPCGDLTFVAGANGRPLTKESFGNVFREACRAAGVPGSAHGVRKIAATRAAENGATVAELRRNERVAFRCCSELEAKGTEFYGGTAHLIATKEPPNSTNHPGHGSPSSSEELSLARRLRPRCDAHHKKAFCACLKKD